jgi:hypothetical protein
MLNKKSILFGICNLFSSDTVDWSKLTTVVVKPEWCEPEAGDFPNYPFVYHLAQDYIVYSKTLKVPLAEGMVYENLVRYVASLAKQDPAYYTRFNGILFKILKDSQKGKISQLNGQNLEYLKFIVGWWDAFDGRERNHDVYKKFLDYIVRKYETDEFYQFSIDYCLNWVKYNHYKFVYADEMNPKKWYGNCGVGLMDNVTMGGQG